MVKRLIRMKTVYSLTNDITCNCYQESASNFILDFNGKVTSNNHNVNNLITAIEDSFYFTDIETLTITKSAFLKLKGKDIAALNADILIIKEEVYCNVFEVSLWGEVDCCHKDGVIGLESFLDGLVSAIYSNI